MGILVTIGYILIVVGVILFVLTALPIGAGWGRNGWGGGIGFIVLGVVLLLLGYLLPAAV